MRMVEQHHFMENSAPFKHQLALEEPPRVPEEHKEFHLEMVLEAQVDLGLVEELAFLEEYQKDQE